ncbi:hypothetical protein TVAG_309580 [Trichomonas vaginalis G3]|uniref:Importin N-terminal domain-containing protein n=1 Tax=Trichomonas vaginalis (strain ATCC PRA-98 / G3) TaxID=412133 RepID=A2FGD5_TRIV3|nr:hypothetical protein TVAG_309580 [Trichomonas vaginalis G3]|eukprot:XP_001308969.1 hypothetical protein [Trichomonas vaginalis G3]
MDDAAEFLKKTIETTPWNEIFIYANKIIQDPTKSQVGLHIWNEIYQFYTSDDSRQALFHIFTICNEILTSSTHPDDQNEALNFLQFHLVRIEEYLSEEEKNIGEQIITTVQNEIHSNLYSNHNEQELNSYIRIVCNLVAESPEFIQESKSDFLQIAISACSDDSIPIKLRISMHNIIEAFAEIIALENREEIPMIINNSCNLAIEACRNDLDYNFPLSFFYGLSKSFSDDAEELFQIFMQIVQELTTNDDGDELMKTCCKKVSLLILRSISEGFQEIIAENIEYYLEVALQNDIEDDEEVVNSICNVIREITDNTPESLIPFVDDIVEYLVSRINNHDALVVLDNLLFKVEKTPTNISEMIQILMTDIEEKDDFVVEKVLSCITSGLQHFDEVDETIFESLSPFLSKFFENRKEMKEIVLECYGRLTKTCPQSIKAHLNEIVDLIEESFSSENCQIDNLCRCIEEISLVLCRSISEFIPVIVPPLCCIIQDKEKSAKEAAPCLRCLSKLFGLIPNEMEEYLPFIVDNLKKKPFESSAYVSPCIEGIAYCIDGLLALNQDTSFFIQTFLPCIKGYPSKDSFFGFLLISGTAFSSISNLTQEFFDEYFGIFIDALNLKFLGLLKSDTSKEIDPSLIHPLFYAFSQFLHVAGPELCLPCLEVLYNTLHSQQNCSSLMRIYSLNLLSRFCLICHLESEIYDITMNEIFSFLNVTDNDLIVRTTLQSLFYLVSTSKTKTIQNIETIYGFVRKCLDNFNSPKVIRKASVVLAKLLSEYNFDNTSELIEEMLVTINPEFDSDEIVGEAEFCFYLIKNGFSDEELVAKIACEFLSSMDFYISQVSDEIYQVILQKVSTFDEETIAAIVKYNQYKIEKILSHLQR